MLEQPMSRLLFYIEKTHKTAAVISPADCMLGLEHQAWSLCCRHRSHRVLADQATRTRSGHLRHHQSSNI